MAADATGVDDAQSAALSMAGLALDMQRNQLAKVFATLRKAAREKQEFDTLALRA